MKFFTPVIFILSMVYPAMTQEYQYVSFPDSNAVWSEVHWKPIFDPPPRWVYNQYALFNEDTVINGIIYHKLFHTNTTEFYKENTVCVGMLREDNYKRIWFKYNTTGAWPNTNENGEYLLYDFNLEEGDTVHCYENNLQSQGVDFLVLDSVKFIYFNNSLRKVFCFNIPWEVWIEGIGKIKGIIYPSGDLLTNGENNDLVCMHQNDTLLYYYSGAYDVYYDDCVPSFVINGIPLLANLDVKIYPNPVTTGIVYFENLDFETLELFDLNGNLIQEENIKGSNVFELKIPGLPPGAYTYRLKTKGLVPTQGKLVVQ